MSYPSYVTGAVSASTVRYLEICLKMIFLENIFFSAVRSKETKQKCTENSFIQRHITNPIPLSTPFQPGQFTIHFSPTQLEANLPVLCNMSSATHPISPALLSSFLVNQFDFTNKEHEVLDLKKLHRRCSLGF